MSKDDLAKNGYTVPEENVLVLKGEPGDSSHLTAVLVFKIHAVECHLDHKSHVVCDKHVSNASPSAEVTFALSDIFVGARSSNLPTLAAIACNAVSIKPKLWQYPPASKMWV